MTWATKGYAHFQELLQKEKDVNIYITELSELNGTVCCNPVKPLPRTSREQGNLSSTLVS